MSSRLQVTFGENVRNLRLEKGWTQAELAKKLKRRQTEISDLENGHHAPSLATVEEVAKVFGVPANKLL
jgi:transcriptional regulator with XRE-family HTH domain